MSLTFAENTIVHADVLDGLAVIPDNIVTLFLTSPPYNVDIKYGVHNDNMPYLDYIQWLKKIWAECFRALRPGGRLIINIDATTNLQSDGRDRMNCIYADLYNICKEVGFLFYQEHVWVKQNRCGKKTAWGSYRSPSLPSCLRSHEYILVFSKPNHNYTSPTDKYKLDGDDSKKRITHAQFAEWVGSEWHIPPVTTVPGGHQAPFPEELAYRAINLYTYPNDLVIDPFSGSGTTCVVAKQSKRRYFGIDNDKHFVKYSLERLDDIIDIYEDDDDEDHVTRREQERRLYADKQAAEMFPQDSDIVDEKKKKKKK